ncbi:TKL protein kinase [Salpingoeca rosetta]|uniref:TKL protein kinase n=1 Tax=Salpingoeca rosetta (strain ATCC 50818 / BSB-021) TaxID=946362 RepID=F2UR54_SALR5|nr:TKL protein kinase [Salpingoeca rosetta]EGD80109.1 TKL protein kinase [Salpingoeca rosetta]|eukprot:XP_004988434.1 TKL protein kinase [Salpingoeca rosetta]
MEEKTGRQDGMADATPRHRKTRSVTPLQHGGVLIAITVTTCLVFALIGAGTAAVAVPTTTTTTTAPTVSTSTNATAATLAAPAWVGAGCSAHADSCTSIRSSIHALLQSIQSREQRHTGSYVSGDNDATELSHLRTIEAFVNQFCPPPPPPTSTPPPPPPPPPPRLPSQPPQEQVVQRVRRASTTTTPATTTTTASTTTTTTSTTRAQRFADRAVVCTLTRSTPFDCTNPRDVPEMVLKIQGSGKPLPVWYLDEIDIFNKFFIDPTTPTNLIIEGSVFLEDLVWLLQFRWDTVTNITIRGYEGVEFPLAVLNPMTNVHTVDLAGNDITRLVPTNAAVNTIPFTLGDSITTLDVTRNSLSQLPQATLAVMPNLKQLTWDGNQLAAIEPGAFSATPQLATLSLRNNRISNVVARTFAGLISLRELDLSNNGISKLDDDALLSVVDLRRLNLDQNPIEAFPTPLFAKLTRLRHLYLTTTRATKLPTGLFEHNTRLQELWLFHNRFTEIEVGTFDKLTRLVFLTLTGNDITHLPAMLFARLTRLKELYISDNDVRNVDPNAFHGPESLTTLSLLSNSINDIDPETFTTVPALEYVDLSGNALTRVAYNLLSGCPRLTELVLSDNRMTQFDHVPLPGLKILRIHDNPLVEQPDAGIFPNLTTLRMNNHRVPWVNFTLAFVLPHLTTLELSADPSFEEARVLPIPEIEARAATATPANDDGAGAGGAGILPLRVLDVRNIELPAVFDQSVRSRRFRLKRFAAGWPGMTEATIPSDVLCQALDPNVEELMLTSTGYTSINVCPNITFRAVFLQENAQLHTVHIHNPLEQLNLFRSEKMQTLLLPRADVIDLSYTKISSITPLCGEWGSRVLFYRGVQNPLLAQRGVELFQRCLRNVEVVDFTDSTWLYGLDEIRDVTRRPTILSTQQFQAEDRSSLHSRAEAPVVTMQNTPVQCRIGFLNENVRPVDQTEAIQSQLAYNFRCQCSNGYTARAGKCVEDPTSIIVIALSVTFIVVMVVVLPILYYQYRRYRRTQQRNVNLDADNRQKQRELDKTNEEVKALKAVWEIGHEELRFEKCVASGAHGDVWRAEWDAVPVAVKVLKQNVMLFDESTVAEFEKEVEFLRCTRHPNVVRFFGAGTRPGGSPFLVLEFVAHGSLRGLLRKGKLPQLLQDYKRILRTMQTAALGGGGSGGSNGGGRKQYRGDQQQQQQQRRRVQRRQHNKVKTTALDGSDLRTRLLDDMSGTDDDDDHNSGYGGGGDIELGTPGHSNSSTSGGGRGGGGGIALEHSYDRDSIRRHQRERPPADVWELKQRLALDVADGMAFIHRLGHFHRDLKSGNVLVSKHLRAKITDFGTIRQHLTATSTAPAATTAATTATTAHMDRVSRPTISVMGTTTAHQQDLQHQQQQQQQQSSSSATPSEPTSPTAATASFTTATGAPDTLLSASSAYPQELTYSAETSATTHRLNLTAGIGTPMYMAPEVLMGSKYDAKADVFSFGVVLWEMVTEHQPDLIAQEKGSGFRGPLLSTMSTLLNEGKRLALTDDNDTTGVPGLVTSLSRECMAQDPAQRPTFEAIALRIKASADM